MIATIGASDTRAARRSLVLINRLSRLMGERRMTMQAVVRGTGLARQTVTDLYHDKSLRIDLATLNKLCEFLNVGPEQIFERVPDAPPTSSAE